MPERIECSNATNKSIESHGAWFDALTLNPFEKELATAHPSKFLNPCQDARGTEKAAGKVEISPLELEDYGLKRRWYKDETGSGYATDYPFGLTVVRYEAGNFMLRLPAGVKHTENRDGLTTVFNAQGKKIATFESDGTLHVRTKDGTFTETPNGDVSFAAKPGKTGKKPAPTIDSEKDKQHLPDIAIDDGAAAGGDKGKSSNSSSNDKHKLEQKTKSKDTPAKKVPFDPLEGLDLDGLSY